MRPSQQFTIHRPDHSPAELPTTSFDVICIGSGWAGRVAAARLVKAGLTAVIVENELVGGDCPYWACVPSKALLRPPEALAIAKDVSGAKQRINGEQGLDVDAAFKRRDAITMGKDDTVGLIPLVEKSGATLVRGTGKLVGKQKVQVTPLEGNAVTLDARVAVILANGSEPTMSTKIKGLREADPWTPRDATSASYAPTHLVIMGAGAVGCEMAQVYSRYGSKVTVISSSPEILPSFDDEAGKIVREAMESQGVTFHLGAKVASVSRPSPEDVHVELTTGQRVSGTELLVAAGRQANLTGLGLDSVGVAADQRFLQVDDNLCVQSAGGSWLYAAGDINGRAPLTHSCKYHGAIVANAIIAGTKTQPGAVSGQKDWSSSNASADHHAVPQVVFTDPVAASVGLSRKAAEKKHISFRQVTADLSGPGYSVHSDHPAASWAQWLLDDGDRLIGATFVGTDAAELLHASTVAIVGGVPLQRLMHAIPSFPSLSWVYYNLMDAAGV